MSTKREQILQALSAFVRQRPGLEFGNYGDVSAYRSELRGITKDRHQAEELLAAVALREGIDADALLKAAKHSFSGRLSIEETDKGIRIEYCTGQYWPTEYRRAVCSVLSGALWDYWRDVCNESPIETARAELSRSVARRWFN